MVNGFFARQLGTYASYHRAPRNRLTHLIGIPALVFSILVPLALLRLTGGLSLATVVAVVALLGWIALDRGGGIAMAMMIVPLLLVAEWIAASAGNRSAWIVFAVFFLGGWIFQLGGHGFEGRRPALMDNLFQAFIGPMFIMAEVLMALGMRQDLRQIVDPSAASAAGS